LLQSFEHQDGNSKIHVNLFIDFSHTSLTHLLFGVCKTQSQQYDQPHQPHQPPHQPQIIATFVLQVALVTLGIQLVEEFQT
jgi:hypothetical protein